MIPAADGYSVLLNKHFANLVVAHGTHFKETDKGLILIKRAKSAGYDVLTYANEFHSGTSEVRTSVGSPFASTENRSKEPPSDAVQS